MKKLFGILAVLTLFAGISSAQVTAGQGAVAGNVADSSKAVIPGAHVVLANPSIGFRAETNANSEGHFSFTALTVVGGYTLTVSSKGFNTAVVQDITTSVGTVITQNVALTVGAESTTVEVEGASVEQVQTDTSAVSQLIDKTIWQESPLSVRDSNSFVGLVAGAAGDSAGTGRGYAVNGARTGTGNFLLEGFDNNDQGLGGGAGGGAVTSISPDAIQEYRVITSVPPAEYGRAGAFSTDTVLRSGTKQWHGSAFEYNRIQALAQNNFFSKRANLRDHLVRNQFGGSFGGPVYKDRTFFFATVEFQRQRQGSPGTFTGVTQDFYNFVQNGNYEKWMEGTAFQNTATIYDKNANNGAGGNIDGLGLCPENFGTTCPGQFASAATLGPIFQGLYKQAPQQFPFGTYNFTNIPTDLLIGDTEYTPVNIYGTGNVINTSVYNENRGTLKLDHKLTSKDQLSFTYSAEIDNTSNNTGFGGGYPGPGELDFGGAQIFGARYTRTFTPHILNEFRASYLRHVRNFVGVGIAEKANVPNIESADSISTGFGESSAGPQLFTENQFAYEDAVTWSKGLHNFKGGFRFVRTRNGSSFYNDPRGTLYPWGTPDLLTDNAETINGLRLFDGGNTGPFHSAYGTIYYGSASQDPSIGALADPYRGYRANEFNAYLQDDFKISPRLTVNYGLRWDYFGPPHNFRAGLDSNVYFGSATTPTATGNPFLPNVPLLAEEQGASFQCVGYTPCGNSTPGSAGYAAAANRSTIWKQDFNNVAPRLGFSYDTLGNGKFVIRGGFGIGYDRLYNNVYENIRFNGPHFVDNTSGYGAGQAGTSYCLTTGAAGCPNAGTPLYSNPFVGNFLLSGGAVPRHVDQNLLTAYYEQAHLGFETQFGRGYVVETNYIGTFGHKLVGLMNANTFEGRVACYSGSTTFQAARCKAAGYTTFSTSRPNTTFGNDNYRNNQFSSNYNGLQLSVRKGFANGFQFNGNYTYSKAMDEISDVFTVKNGGTGIPTPYNPSHNYGAADFDVRHLAKFTVNYRTTSEKHKLLLAGWGISPILTMSSGTPIYNGDSNSTYDPNKDNVTGVEQTLYTGPGDIRSAKQHGTSPAGNGKAGTGFLKPNVFSPYVCPLNVNAGLFCDVPGSRNSLYGLRQYNLDAAVSKHLYFGDRFSLTLQAAFFDIDGHTEFANPSADINSNSYGESTSAGNREGQLSARIDF